MSRRPSLAWPGLTGGLLAILDVVGHFEENRYETPRRALPGPPEVPTRKRQGANPREWGRLPSSRGLPW